VAVNLGECASLTGPWEGSMCLNGFIPANWIHRCDACGCGESKRCFDLSGENESGSRELGGMHCLRGDEVCLDGTPINQCSNVYPGASCLWTPNGALHHVGKCDICKACPQGLECGTDPREGRLFTWCFAPDVVDETVCADGTAVASCSPYYPGFGCTGDAGQTNHHYEPSCDCGCPEGFTCDDHNSCVKDDVTCQVTETADPRRPAYDCRGPDDSLYDDLLFQAVCGDGKCQGDEAAGACPQDCGGTGEDNESCEDGTPLNACSETSPGMMCLPTPEGPQLRDKPECGSSGQTCPDGTPVHECSSVDPGMFCVTGPNGPELIPSPRCDEKKAPPGAPDSSGLFLGTLLLGPCEDGTDPGACSMREDGRRCRPSPEGMELGFDPACLGSAPWAPLARYSVDADQECVDGTRVFSCSSERPRRCVPDETNRFGRLIDDCAACGCPAGSACARPRSLDTSAAARLGVLPGRCTTVDLEVISAPRFDHPDVRKAKRIVPIGTGLP
jgi:hypothetical protein